MGLAKKTLKARELYARMMRTLAQTGNGWMTFKDACNRACNQTAKPGNNVVHPSVESVRTEILEVTDDGSGDGGVQSRFDQPCAPPRRGCRSW